jgi:O-phospho-L-seryl-tRNASec:L-selenocysteinyl-tRNA synthase
VKDLLLLPLATGMALSLSFLTLSEYHPSKKYVLWSRIDQKTCLKSILTANLIPVVIELMPVDDFLTTDLKAM